MQTPRDKNTNISDPALQVHRVRDSAIFGVTSVDVKPISLKIFKFKANNLLVYVRSCSCSSS